jgi:hypothetical protein
MEIEQTTPYVAPYTFGKTKFADWLRENRWHCGGFARDYGFHPSEIQMFAGGSRRPTLEKALRIEKITKRKVKVQDWI